MKACMVCYRMNKDDAKECIECGSNEFNHVIFPFYNDAGEYVKEEENGKEKVD